MFWFFIWALSGSVAYAGPSEGELDYAEYSRLTEEIQSLAKRNAWDGVERSYQKLLKTDVPPTDADYVAAAQAAQARGDITACRDRLVLALEIAEVQEYTDWLERIQDAYGPVSLRGDPGKVALATEKMPFDPAKAKAIRYAIAQVEDSGTYEGLLPEGEYTFGDFDVKVQPGISKQRIDIRSDRYARKMERKERRRQKREERRERREARKNK